MKLKEQEYINVRDLQRVETAKNLLSMVIPQSSKVIDDKEHLTVMQIISKWEQNLYNEIEKK